MKNLLKYTLIAAIFAGASACTKLDENLPGSFTKSFTPSNPGVGIKNNVNKAQPVDGLQGAFSRVLNGTAGNGGFFAVQEGGTDEAVITQKGGDWYDGGLYIKMHHHEYTPQTWGINDAWNDSYGGIYQCNTLLENPDVNVSAAKVAQLRFLRSYFYWRLLDVFGNVPVVLSTAGGAAQSTRANVYAFIEQELLDAMPDLPPGHQDYGRASQGSANALLSRLYLNAEVYTGTPQWDKTIAAADEVINSGVYDISPEYGPIFDPRNVDNIEHIFVAPFDEATGGGAVWPFMTLHYPSQLTYKLTMQPWNGFSSLEEFYNSYSASDARKAVNFIAGPQYDYNGAPILDLAFDKADPDGAPINYTPAINELYPNASRQAGVRFGKFAFKIGQGGSADNDFPLLRYTEVLFNKAEATARKNGNWADGGAQSVIAPVLTRAGGVAAPSTQGEWLAERGREFFVEAFRRTDLIRYGAYGNSWWENPGDADIATHKLMAIPIEQIQAAASTSFPLNQNPGY